MEFPVATHQANSVLNAYGPAILARQVKLAQQRRRVRTGYVHHTDGEALVEYVRSRSLDDDLAGIHIQPRSIRPSQGLAQSHQS